MNAALRLLYTTAAISKTGSCELAPPAWHCRVWFHAGAAATSVLVALTCCVSRSLYMWQMSEGKGYYLNCHCASMHTFEFCLCQPLFWQVLALKFLIGPEKFLFVSVASQKFFFQTNSIMSPLVPIFFTALVASALGEEGQARILISKQVNFWSSLCCI